MSRLLPLSTGFALALTACTPGGPATWQPGAFTLDRRPEPAPLATAEPAPPTASPPPSPSPGPFPDPRLERTPAPTTAPSAVPTPGSTGGGGRGGAAAVPTPAPLPLAVCATAPPRQDLVATLAGGTYGYQDGAAARFRYPVGLALAPDGALFVADARNRAVRRVGPDGQVTTVVGGPVDEALGEPAGLAVAPDGTLWVGDVRRHAIYRVPPGGAPILVAGGNGPGWVDDVGTAAWFDDPRGLALLADGGLAIADLNNRCIRHLAPDGTVTTLAGSPEEAGSADGPGADARFVGPVGVAALPDGGLAVADAAAHALRLVAPDGEVTTLVAGAAGDADGPLATARLRGPGAIAADATGAIYVADGDPGSRIRKVAAGAVATLAGAATPGSANGTSEAARFHTILGLAADTCGRLYLADGFMRIRQLY